MSRFYVSKYLDTFQTAAGFSGGLSILLPILASRPACGPYGPVIT